MKVSPTNILSALLRHHVRPGLNANEKSAEINSILNELSGASSVSEKHAIIERLLLREQREIQAAARLSGDGEPADDGEVKPTWRMSSKSTELINGLKTEHFSRQWETEEIIRSIFEHHAHANEGENIPGLAMPFKPSAQDMAKAIEDLGYSARALYRNSPVHNVFEDVPERGGTAFRLALMAVGVAIIALVVIAA